MKVPAWWKDYGRTGTKKQRPKGWHRALRSARKRQRMARKANR